MRNEGTMPTIAEIRKRWLDESRARGCSVKEGKAFWRIDGSHSSQWFNVAKTGTKVTLTGFCVPHPGVLAFSREDSQDMHMGRVEGMFDFTHPDAGKVFAAIWTEIRADRRD
jgi:hypothetical protein